MMRPATRAACAAVVLAACSDGHDCVVGPCPSFAGDDLEVVVTSPTSNVGVVGGFVVISAPGTRDSVPCGSWCTFSRGTGTYQLDIGAPGYATQHKSLAVTKNAGSSCGCGFPQRLDIVLAPTP